MNEFFQHDKIRCQSFTNPLTCTTGTGATTSHDQSRTQPRGLPARPRRIEPSDRRPHVDLGPNRGGGAHGERAGRAEEGGRERLREEAGGGRVHMRRRPSREPRSGWSTSEPTPVRNGPAPAGSGRSRRRRRRRDADASHGDGRNGGGGELERERNPSSQRMRKQTWPI